MLVARVRTDFKSSDAFVPVFSEVPRSGRLRWTFDVRRSTGGEWPRGPGDEKNCRTFGPASSDALIDRTTVEMTLKKIRSTGAIDR
jgi:hypothetical protein